MQFLGGIVHIDKHPFAHFGLAVIFLLKIMFRAKRLSVIDVRCPAKRSWANVVDLYIDAVGRAQPANHATVTVPLFDRLFLFFGKIFPFIVDDVFRIVAV